MNTFKLKKSACLFLLQFILLPAVFITPLAANSSPNGNQGQGNGNHGAGNGKGHQKIHGNNGNNKGAHVQAKNNAKSNKYYDKQRNANVNFTVSFGNVRPLAIEYGLTGYQGLPPGIAKQVSRGKPLPPGIAKKSLPAGFTSQLPVYVGYEWKISGRDLLLVAVGTTIVAEVIENVFE
ncbi:hypothetical protein HBA43_08770 [Providencia rettgeri]|uniref:anti-virulence regulator CigR family protein n=1 Tax=Providencia TaxID=586 RepID=UPI0014194326|nr:MULTISPECIES: anti-virulence regulator CigR family protein [Providencia]EJD6369472.1 hypothetical protein [Providencia rettgeri]EJD6372863.1 hypothetical protein [Providencia rettgeri]ELR5031538.1 hypothetical protein [Providencia rettgeri]ELR5130894.1 hypothetical protein [Providencia rettgeri]ELR5159329.1 hypothetical protein [Providencia rettgeri]